jgi:hypothetical protein
MVSSSSSVEKVSLELSSLEEIPIECPPTLPEVPFGAPSTYTTKPISSVTMPNIATHLNSASHTQQDSSHRLQHIIEQQASHRLKTNLHSSHNKVHHILHKVQQYYKLWPNKRFNMKLKGH